MKSLKHYGPLWALLLLLLLSLSGAPKAPPPANRYTLRAEITYQNRTFRYQEPQKLVSVLTWLRLLRPGSPVKAVPDAQTAPQFSITLYHSDGTLQTYHLLACRYLTTDHTTWRPVSPTYAQQIYTLLHLLPPDS